MYDMFGGVLDRRARDNSAMFRYFPQRVCRELASQENGLLSTL